MTKNEKILRDYAIVDEFCQKVKSEILSKHLLDHKDWKEDYGYIREVSFRSSLYEALEADQASISVMYIIFLNHFGSPISRSRFLEMQGFLRGLRTAATFAKTHTVAQSSNAEAIIVKRDVMDITGEIFASAILDLEKKC
jgi:hypothetical protein